MALCVNSNLHRELIFQCLHLERNFVGKGTNATDGMALLAATVNFFAKQAEECPLTVFTTHFRSVHWLPIFVAYGHMKLSRHRTFPWQRQFLTAACMPLTLFSSEIFSLEELSKNGVKPCQMDIMLSTAGSTRDVVPLFKLVPGTSMGSFGYACARASGIDENVVTRAEEIARAIESGDQIVPAFNNVEVEHFIPHA